MSNKKIELEDTNIARVVFGERDRHLSFIEDTLGIQVFVRGTQITLQGSSKRCQQGIKLILELYDVVKKGYLLKSTDVELAARMITSNPSQSLSEIFLDSVANSSLQHNVTPKTQSQKTYVEAIRKADIVFGWGPAGTGKTYLAMAMAVSCLTNKKVERIILTRPAVEAGERLGFLPGDLAEKVNPYLRPLYDALHDMMSIEKAQRFVEKGIIEVAPLAFMRGRTLNNSFVILDEAQNTTSDQMKMFLTRLGFGSKAVITGDITQIDLPTGKTSGLIEALKLFQHIDEIKFVQFTHKDVVRHPLVQQIILAYEAAAKKSRQPN